MNGPINIALIGMWRFESASAKEERESSVHEVRKDEVSDQNDQQTIPELQEGNTGRRATWWERRARLGGAGRR